VSILFIVVPPVSLYIIGTHIDMLECIYYGRDRLYNGKENRPLGKDHLINFTCLIFANASKMTRATPLQERMFRNSREKLRVYRMKDLLKKSFANRHVVDRFLPFGSAIEAT